jgi:hypothetical protein
MTTRSYKGNIGLLISANEIVIVGKDLNINMPE